MATYFMYLKATYSMYGAKYCYHILRTLYILCMVLSVEIIKVISSNLVTSPVYSSHCFLKVDHTAPYLNYLQKDIVMR